MALRLILGLLMRPCDGPTLKARIGNQKPNLEAKWRTSVSSCSVLAQLECDSDQLQLPSGKPGSYVRVAWRRGSVVWSK